jgi:hypothetical protein
MSSYTPGPWYEADGGVFGIWDETQDERPTVCYIVGRGMNGPQTAEGLANARLIAAAPELLEALKREHTRGIPGHSYDGHDCPVCQLIRRCEG